MLVDSGIGVVPATTPGSGKLSKTSSGGIEEGGGTEEGVRVGGCVDRQKDRLRVDPNPTTTLDRGFRVRAWLKEDIRETR